MKPVVEEDLSARLASMKEQILSRSRIEPIIKQFNLFANGKPRMDDRVELTQKAIGVKPIPPAVVRGMPGFYITFKAQDARTAQQVCGEITSLFVSENLSAREAVGRRHDRVSEAATRRLKEEPGRAGCQACGLSAEVFRQASRPATVQYEHASGADNPA